MGGVVAAIAAIVTKISVGKFLFGIAFNFVLGAVSRKLSKPKATRTTSATSEARERRHIIRASTPPRRWIYGEVLTSGALVHIERIGDHNLVMIVAYAAHECEQILDHYLNENAVGARDADGVVTEGTWKRISDGSVALRIVEQLGGADADGFASGTDNFPPLHAVSSRWTIDHKGIGICAVWYTLYYDRSVDTDESGDDLWPTGVPNPMARIRGRRVYDPRTGVTEWSDNPAVCILDYLRDPDGYGEDDSRIDFASFIAGADVCDQLVTYLDAEGNEQQGKRYRLSGTHTEDSERRDIMEGMLSACGGRLTRSQGVYYLHVAAPPTVTLDALTVDDLRGDVVVRARPSRADLVNTVVGEYPDETQLWRVIEFAPVTAAAYVAQDGGEKFVRRMELPYTPRAYIARRLAKIELERARQGIEITLPLKMAAIELTVWDVVPVTISDLGWSDKLFRVTSVQLEQDGGITVSAQEDALSIYDLDPDDELEADPAPDTALVVQNSPGRPGRPVVDEILYIARNGAGVRARASLSWSPPVADAVAAQYEIRYRDIAGEVWLSGPTVPASQLSAQIDDLPAGTYDFAVRGVSPAGAASAWATTRRLFLGLSALPSAPTGLRLSMLGGNATLLWDRTPDLDVEVGGSFVLRHSPLTSGATWVNGIPVSDSIPGAATQVTIPAQAGTYMLRSRDSTGQLSATVASITTTAPTVVNWTVAATVDEHPSFAGVKSGFGVAAGVMSVDVIGNVASWADFGAVASVAQETGAVASALYTFQNRIDLGSVKTVRILPDVVTDVALHLTTVGARGLPISQWHSFSGVADGDVATATLEWRTTPDDPSGSPTWSDWERLGPTEVSIRAAEFRLRCATHDHAYRLSTDSLGATAYEVT